MSTNEFRLSVRRGPEEGQTFTLSSSSVTVGRDPMAEIVLSDPEVSRQHARFTRMDHGYELQDLGSTNGTFVDGKRLGGEAVTLEAGAVITMGSNVTLVYEATVDPMATVISPEGSLDFDEPEEISEPDDALRTMIEDVDAAEEPFEPGEASFDDGLEEKAFEEQGVDDAAGSDYEATSVEFPPVVEPEALPVYEEEEEDFSFDFDEGEFGEPVATGDVASDDRTVLDMEASDISSFAQPPQEESLPSFEESSELPSFDEPQPSYNPPPAGGEASKTPPPPPPPVSPSEPDPNRRRNLIIGVIVLLLLCCCCSILVTYFYLGDIILEYVQF